MTQLHPEATPDSALRAAAKAAVRAEIRARLAALTDAQWQQASHKACDAIVSSDMFRCAAVIAGYAALPREIDVRGVLDAALAAKKIVCLPRVVVPAASHANTAPPPSPAMDMCFVRDLSKDLAPGAHRVLEPAAQCRAVDPRDIELVLVPGRAFTRSGIRLGRGGGYYDHFLARSKATKLGLCTCEQILDTLPADSWDARMHALLSPDGLCWCD